MRAAGRLRHAHRLPFVLPHGPRRVDPRAQAGTEARMTAAADAGAADLFGDDTSGEVEVASPPAATAIERTAPRAPKTQADRDVANALRNGNLKFSGVLTGFSVRYAQFDNEGHNVPVVQLEIEGDGAVPFSIRALQRHDTHQAAEIAASSLR